MLHDRYITLISALISCVCPRVDSETNLRDILDKVHEIKIDNVDDTHFFYPVPGV